MQWTRSPQGTEPDVREEEPVSVRNSSGAFADHANDVVRAPDDEAVALAARIRYRAERIAPMPAGHEIAGHLEPGESLLATQDPASLERRQPAPGQPLSAGLPGRLIVTSDRLALIGRRDISFDLGDVVETAMAGRHVLVTMRDGTGFAVEVARPRLLRVEIAAAKAAARSG